MVSCYPLNLEPTSGRAWKSLRTLTAAALVCDVGTHREIVKIIRRQEANGQPLPET